MNPPTPPSSTPETDAEVFTYLHPSGVRHEVVFSPVARKLERELDEALKAGGFCEKHKPDGGARNCLVCGCEKLSFALSQISYLCGAPNEMRVSEYDTHFNEEEVVKQVDQLRAELSEANQKLNLWETGLAIHRHTNAELANLRKERDSLKYQFKEANEKLAEASLTGIGIHADLSRANEQLSTLRKDKERLKSALQRVWDEDECGWILNGIPTIPNEMTVECVKCGAKAITQKLIIHSEECTQGFIFEALTAIDTAIQSSKGTP